MYISIETLPKVFQVSISSSHLRHAMGAMKEAVAGMYRDDYWKDLAILLSYTLISLIVGLVLAVPFRKLNHILEESKEKSGVML